MISRPITAELRSATDSFFLSEVLAGKRSEISKRNLFNNSYPFVRIKLACQNFADLILRR